MIPVELRQRSDPAYGAIDVDEQGYTITCVLAYPAFKGEPRTTSQLYGAVLGVRDHCNLLIVGDVTFTIVAADRLRDFDWRIGPAVLHRQPLPPIDAVPSITPRFVVDWAGDDRADVEADVHTLFDPECRIARLTFGTDPAHWHEMATDIYIGTNQTGDLAAIQLEAFPANLWSIVGRR